MLRPPMARRRGMTFRAYARRRWRAVGLTVVAMVATVLLLALLDRGHEPLWREAPGDVALVAASPDGRIVLAAREHDGRLVGVEGYDARSGHRLWARDVNLSAPATVAAGAGWFALATPFPEARLVAYHAIGGNVLHDEFLGAEPRGVAADGDRLALALRSGLILVYDGFQLVREHRTPPLVSAIDAAGGRIAAATAQGNLLVLSDEGVLVNATRPVQVQSVRLSADGTRLVLGGRTLAEGDLSGALEYFDLTARTAAVPAWSTTLRARASFTALSDDGRYVAAVQETATRYTIAYWDAVAGAQPRWAVQVDGAIYRGNAGATGGAALSPSGRYVVFAPDLGGDVQVVDGWNNAFRWSYRAEGATSVAFVGSGERFASNARLVPNQGYDALLLFDVEREPLYARFPSFALALAALEGLVGAAGLAGAYAWYRRQ